MIAKGGVPGGCTIALIDLYGRQVTCDTRNSVTCSSHKCDAKIPSLVAVQPLTLQAHL